MTALRVGVDLIEIDRVRRALERHGDGFRSRCFTEEERAYCDSKPNPAQHYAGRFAAKEAVGRRSASASTSTWREIEISGRPKPGVHLERPHHRRRSPSEPARARHRASMTHLARAGRSRCGRDGGLMELPGSRC